MALSCIIGFHKWDGCKCTKCGKTRDEGHDQAPIKTINICKREIDVLAITPDGKMLFSNGFYDTSITL